MSYSFECTLHNPLTKEEWDKITDVELERTTSVTFQTPQGRQVRYIKCEVLDKIRDEILEYIDDLDIATEICDIFDKYMTESEG